MTNKFFQSICHSSQALSSVTQPGIARRQFFCTVSAARHEPGIVMSKLTDHTLFTRRYADLPRANGQRILLPWKQKYSETPTKQMKITTLNAAMRSQKRGPGLFDYNTGLNTHETLEQYEDRTEENGYVFGCAVMYSAIGNVLEGPIHAAGIARFQAGLDRACPGRFKIEDVTLSWGVLTISNRDLLPQGLIKNTCSPFVGKMRDLEDRIVTFNIPGYATPFTTLHLPHGDPQKALTFFAQNIKVNIMKGILAGQTFITELAAGDFNRHPEQIEQALRDELEDFFPADLEVQTKCKIYYNHDGHLRNNGKFITVDASVVVTVGLPDHQLVRAQAFVEQYQAAKAAPLIERSSLCYV